jgi:hypothetical protein
MATYHRRAREARVKCLPCNAPVTETMDGDYVCVECGRSPFDLADRPPVRVDGGVSRPRRPWVGERDEPPVVEVPEETDVGSADAADSPYLLPAESRRQPVISFVLPTKNEEGGIGECIDRAVAAVTELELPAEILVSDSSDDRTPEIARRKGAIVVEPDRPGYGYAYRYAFEHARGDVIVMGDADTTYDFGELPALLEPIESGDADIVLGSRFEGEIRPGAMPALHRYVGNPLLTKFLNVFYDAGVSDAHSGFRVFTRDVLDAFTFRSDGMEFASEMVMAAATEGLRIEEVPITYHARTGEAELDSLRDGWRHVKFMLLNAPTHLFAVPGVSFATLGAVALSLAFFGVSLGGVTFGAHTMIAGSLLTIVGYQVTLLALFTTVAADPIRAANDPLTRWIRAHFRLEHGATLGLALTAFGGAYAAVLVGNWVASGFAALPLVTTDMVAFTAIVVGLETLFSSFHLSALR